MRETIEAKPAFGQTHANRGRGWSARFRKSGESGYGGYPCASPLENGIGAGFTARCTTALILAVMAGQLPPARVTDVRSCFRSIAAQTAPGAAGNPFA